MTHPEGDTPEENIPQAPDTKTYLAADNDGNIVIVTEGTDGSVSTTDPSESFPLTRAQDVFLEQQRFHALTEGDDEIPSSDDEAPEGEGPDLDEIRRQIELAKERDQEDEQTE